MKFTSKKTIIVLSIFIVLQSVLTVADTIISQKLIDDVFPSKNIDIILKGTFIFGLICVFGALSFIIKYFIAYKTFSDVQMKIQKMIRDKFVKIDQMNIQNVNFSNLTTLLTEDSKDVANGHSIIISLVLTAILTIIFTIITMIYYNWQITLVLLLVFAVYIYINNIWMKKIKRATINQKKSLEGLNHCNKLIYDTNVMNKIYNKEYFSVLENQYLSTYQKSTFSLNMHKVLNVFFNMIITLVVTTLIYTVGGIFMAKSLMTLGKIIAIGLLFQSLSGPISSLVDGFSQIHKYKNAKQRIIEFMLISEERAEGEYIDDIDSIEFSNVIFRYPNTINTIPPINFKIDHQGLYVLKGTSGIGKTTLLKLLLGFLHDYEGQISINGKNIESISLESLRGLIGYLPQDDKLISGISFIDNITLGESYNVYADEYSRQMEMSGWIEQFNEGMNTIVEENQNISGGQKQRLCLLRVLSKSKDLYIFDEPEIGLSLELKKTIYQILHNVSKDNIVIVVSHDSDIDQIDGEFIYL